MLQLREKKEEKAVKTKDIRVGKREREVKMMEERKKRKETMTAMVMNGRSTYIEGEIEVLEKENQVSQHSLFGGTGNEDF